MSIKPSAAAEVRALVEALLGDDDVRLEAAVARLAVIGPRSVDRLLAAYSAPGTVERSRLAILRVFEAFDDPRGLALARLAVRDGGQTAIAATTVLRSLLASPAGSTSADALDLLVSTVLDQESGRRIRLAAFDALSGASLAVRKRVAAALAEDEDPVVREHVRTGPTPHSALEAAWTDALQGRGLDDPVMLHEAVATHAASAPLGALQKLIDAARDKETRTRDSRRATEWRHLRGALHQALALRRSNVALYDLRETLADATPALAPTFVAALHAIGDASCLEPIAAAFARTDDTRFQQQLAGAFQTIAKREKLSRKSAILKRIAARWPDAIDRISTLSRTTARRTHHART